MELARSIERSRARREINVAGIEEELISSQGSLLGIRDLSRYICGIAKPKPAPKPKNPGGRPAIWNDSHTEFLLSNWSFLTTTQIAKALGFSRATVILRARSLGLPVATRGVVSE